jgi:predicted acyl esterase
MPYRITEFWVPRGYVHVIAHVRGTDDSTGSFDCWGPEERRDLKEMIEFIAGQPWCNGKVGMVGCSYFGCDWRFFGLHLRGAFCGWEGIPASTPKRMLIGPEPVRPEETCEYEIEIIPTCNAFQPGHRLRPELASCDPVTNLIYTHEPIPRVVTNTVHTGSAGSRLLVPFIPR